MATKGVKSSSVIENHSRSGTGKAASRGGKTPSVGLIWVQQCQRLPTKQFSMPAVRHEQGEDAHQKMGLPEVLQSGIQIDSPSAFFVRRYRLVGGDK